VTSADTNVAFAVERVLKGSEAIRTVAFSRPPAPENPRAKLLFCGTPRVLKFAVGDGWLVFLETNQSGAYTMLDAFAGETAAIEQVVREVLELDSVVDEQAKCSFLVQLAARGQGSAGLAAKDLHAFRAPEFLDLFTNLAERGPWARQLYVWLLDENMSPRALPILRGMLKTAEPRLLLDVIDAVARKEPGNGEVSNELLMLADRDEAAIRARAIFALQRREYFEAFPKMIGYLDDPEPLVRAAALSWPWYAYANGPSEVMERIRKLARDPDDSVRVEARRALVDARDLRSFYRLWFGSIFDRSQTVRNIPGLDLLLEKKPFGCLTLLLWPSVCAVLAAWWMTRRLSTRGRFLAIMGGILAGYGLGMCCGYWIGTHRTGNWLVHAVFYEPAAILPFMVFFAALLWRGSPPKAVR
jgi:hypothetical protein